VVFVMTGGGTGGHVVPALAVAEELRRRGHQPSFIGVRHGVEARLVPAAGFPLDWINIRGLQRTGLLPMARSLALLPGAIRRSLALLRRLAPGAIFSMGGYVAGPVMMAAALARLPMVLMEPNAVPGLVSRRMARRVTRALVSFEETARYFPAGVAEQSGLPVREAFFSLPARPAGAPFTVLVTGGSRGARALNRVVSQCWSSAVRFRWLVQTGEEDFPALERDFKLHNIEGRIAPFISDMPALFAEADLVVGRAGAGACAELCAAGKPSILVPFPFAADDHQTANGRALERAGAAVHLPERELSAASLLHMMQTLEHDPERRAAMGQAARQLARPQAARRAADWLERAAGLSAIDSQGPARNN
jgi:UDP-N-acetylglucosamine--N-acetylmuramyl-(pentapeptide) pyrophosphoryl-undecaprenol N-acetylglucosamine transferase